MGNQFCRGTPGCGPGEALGGPARGLPRRSEPERRWIARISGERRTPAGGAVATGPGRGAIALAAASARVPSALGMAYAEESPNLRPRMRRLGWLLLSIFVLMVILNGFLALAGEPTPLFSTFSKFGPLFVQFLPQMLILMLQLPLFFLFNFLIFFGPLIFFGIKQMKGYEPGDTDWGVRLQDVRGQAEPKEEVTRVISLWQSGEEFEKSGGKRERGLLFIGAPGTGKTMLSKAIATSFNAPFITMPGSGFAQTFIGMDVVVVLFLISKARRLARKWGGQCIVFIDEIDAVGMRRQALPGQPGGGSLP